MKLRKKIRVIAADDRTSGWTEPLPNPTEPRRLAADLRADAAVIGAGYTGYAIARRLAETRPDWRLVMLDAQRVGQGTSGRASGFVVDLTDAAALMRPVDRDRYVGLSRHGIGRLEELVERHEIDCAWDDRGWIRGAAGGEGERLLDRLPAIYEELGMRYEPLDHDALAAVTGSRFYRRGIRVPGYPLVDTGRLIHGLYRHLPATAELYEESPVIEIDGSAPCRLRCPEGTLIAPLVFLATNGYTPFLGFLKQRIFPLYTFGSLTRPLDEAEQERLGGEREWGILAMDPMGSSVRRTRDQRILIRNTVHYDRRLRVGESRKEKILDFHRRAFLARFPQLAGVELAHTWAGLMGSSHNSQISFGRLAPGLYVAGAYTAAGLALSQTAGQLLVDLALDAPSPLLDDMRALPKPTWMPPEPFRGVGGHWLAERMNARAGKFL